MLKWRMKGKDWYPRLGLMIKGL